MLRDKILSKNVNEMLDEDLYWHGIDYIRKVYRVMSLIRTLNKEYTIYFDRDDSTYPNGEYEFVCSMRFVNNLGIDVANIKFSEICACQMIDSFYEMCYGDSPDMIIPVNSVDPKDLSSYAFVLTRIPDATGKAPGGNSIQLKLERTSRLYRKNDTLISAILKDENALEDMAYDMYFSYYIDLDDGEGYLKYV